MPDSGEVAVAGSPAGRQDGVAAGQKRAPVGRRHHYPALDGLRGFAFLAVFASHYWTIVEPHSVLDWGGWLGVDLFFVLSGFLITGILFDSLGEPHYFRTFYIRRALRIFPLYYAPWVIFLLLTPWLHPLWNRFDLSRVLYVYNLMDFQAVRHPQIPVGGFRFHTLSGRMTGFNVGPLWSLSLEEQFYLLWPLLLFFVRERRRLLQVCAWGIAASMGLNGWLVWWALRGNINRMFLYNATYAHYVPMLCGAGLALWLRDEAPHREVRARRLVPLTLVPAALLLLLLFAVGPIPNVTFPLIPVLGYLLSGLTSAGLVLATIQQQGWIKRVFLFKPLMSVGTISYGMYVFHGFLMSSFHNHREAYVRHHVLFLLPVVAFGVTWGIATLSYRLYEQPFLRLKDCWAPTRPVAITGRDAEAPLRGSAGAFDAETVRRI